MLRICIARGCRRCRFPLLYECTSARCVWVSRLNGTAEKPGWSCWACAHGKHRVCLPLCRDVFSSGASHYGVADLELLAKETHKFESRYLDNLIAPYPEARSWLAASAMFKCQVPPQHAPCGRQKGWGSQDTLQ